MRKKWLSSVVWVSVFSVGLLLVSPVYLASAALLDRAALNRRIAALQATAVESPAALQARYRVVQQRNLPILPPDPDFTLNPFGGIVVFDPQNFTGWLDVLEPTERDGVTVYPVTVAEDRETRATVFYNGLGEPIVALAAETNYNPFAWLTERHPELYAENADPDLLAWAQAVYDPARVSVTYYLLSSEDVEAMAAAQLAAGSTQQQASLQLLENLPATVTELSIYAIAADTNEVALGICWPEAFTNRLDIYARSNLSAGGWALIDTNLPTAGTNNLAWTDAAGTGLTVRFYRAGNADLDTDGDSLPDARENMLYRTSSTNEDSDADGMNDGFEIVNGLDPFADDGMGNPDHDGFVNAEECVKGTDPKSATGGGGGSVLRFYYDLDDRLTGAFFATNGAVQYGYGSADSIGRVHERRAP
jgi:hypothetical protein